jgi:hypothetical protein
MSTATPLTLEEKRPPSPWPGLTKIVWLLKKSMIFGAAAVFQPLGQSG